MKLKKKIDAYTTQEIRNNIEKQRKLNAGKQKTLEEFEGNEKEERSFRP